MTILKVLPVSSMLGVPFADYLNVTIPKDYSCEVRSLVVDVISSCGLFTESDGGLFHLMDENLRPTKGTFKLMPRGKVLIVSASGQALSVLRSRGLYGDYLHALASFPHRVSMLHATQDYFVSDPGLVVLAVKEAAYAETIYLTRKKIKKEHCRALLSPGAFSAETGTMYLGNKANADVWAKVYDKRHERLSRGYADPGPVVRVEVAVQSDVGATLKDAFDPHDLFFHHASRSLVEAPSSFNGWLPSGEGYVLGPRREVLPHDRLDRYLDFSVDVRSLVALAVSMYGAKASDVLSRHLSKRCEAQLLGAA